MMDTVFDRAATLDQKDELRRSLRRLGVDLIHVVTSIGNEIVVLDRDRRPIAALGPETLGGTLRDIVGLQAEACESACAGALEGRHVVYEWTRRRGRHPVQLSTTASPLRDSSSRIVGIVLVTRLLTDSTREENGGALAAQKKKRLLEVEEGIQQLAGAIENYRRIGQTAVEFRADSPLYHISPRERQVLDLLVHGYRPRSIAEKLRVSPETVRNHLKAMFKKTGTHSQEELAALVRKPKTV